MLPLFFFLPSIEIVRILIFYTLEYLVHSPFVARFCSVSIAGTWTLLEWRIAVAGAGEGRKEEEGTLVMRVIL